MVTRRRFSATHLSPRCNTAAASGTESVDVSQVARSLRRNGRPGSRDGKWENGLKRDKDQTIADKRDRDAGPPPQAPQAPTSQQHVLLVEDNDDSRAMLSLFLSLESHSVHEASNGPDGAAAGIAQQFDVAFIDIGLPGFDGYEVARLIRAAESEQKRAPSRLIALTGYGREDYQRRSSEAGFDLHLVKPVDIDTITRVLATREPALLAGITGEPAAPRPQRRDDMPSR
jgi:CheY-like chemotaxis protein